MRALGFCWKCDSCNQIYNKKPWECPECGVEVCEYCFDSYGHCNNCWSTLSFERREQIEQEWDE